MANREDLELHKQRVEMLRQGAAAWNRWRSENRVSQPDLTAALLNGANLTGADLNHARLDGASLSGANLASTNLYRASLIGADLSGAKLRRADLRGANLGSANLNNADLTMASLSCAKLAGAKLGGADAGDADLTYADLAGADLRKASLLGAVLRGTLLNRTDFSQAFVGCTIFADMDLSGANGLDSLLHIAASTIGMDTLYKSQGKIPDKFLRDAGVPEEIIDTARSIRTGPPIQWYSCCISYSTKDEEFAMRLSARMREANMRVFFAPEDLKGGKKLHEQLFEAIQLNDKLLLVLSEHSIQSEWVMTEIRKARELEKKEKRRKLFPIRLVDFDTLRTWTCFDADSGKDLAVEVREYFIPYFSNWKDPAPFEAAFARLQKDLKAEDRHTK